MRKRFWPACIAAFFFAVPAGAQSAAYTAADFASPLGLAKNSTIADAERLYGPSTNISTDPARPLYAFATSGDLPGVTWLTFAPGVSLDVHCSYVPANVPADAVMALCAAAGGTNWRTSFARWKDMLRLGVTSGGADFDFPPDEEIISGTVQLRDNTFSFEREFADANGTVEATIGGILQNQEATPPVGVSYVSITINWW
jgi:hypothetical protein